jgi:hypothetical protein
MRVKKKLTDTFSIGIILSGQDMSWVNKRTSIPHTLDIVDLAIHGVVCQNLTFMAIVTSKIYKS